MFTVRRSKARTVLNWPYGGTRAVAVPCQAYVYGDDLCSGTKLLLRVRAIVSSVFVGDVTDAAWGKRGELS